MIVRGSIVVVDLDNISTDQIFPGKYVNLTDPTEIAAHVLEGIDKNFRQRIEPGTILVVGKNFGCGSSREQAVITLKESGIRAVVAGSAARIWYRNAINLALPVMICPDVVKQVKNGEKLSITLETGKMHNTSTDTVYLGEPVADFILDIFSHGGTKPMMREKYGAADSRNQQVLGQANPGRGFKEFSGIWTESELQEFEEKTKDLRIENDEDWRKRNRHRDLDLPKKGICV